MKTILNRFLKYLVAIPCLGLCGSCKDFIQIEQPKTQIGRAAIFSNDAGATSAINGIYSSMISRADFASGGVNSLSVLCGLSADELINYATSNVDQANFYTNSVLPVNSILTNAIWGEAYKYIYQANAILEGLRTSNQITQTTKQQIEGEALFVRGFCYFYLVNLFGKVPVVLGTDYEINKVSKLQTTDMVYRQIIADLKQAKDLLSDDYSFSGQERVRPNRWTAGALLARVYLYGQDWPNAEKEADLVTNNSQYSLVKNLDEVFLKNSNEAIWQLVTTSSTQNTAEGQVFILTTTPDNVALDPNLVQSFEKGDLRRSHWVDSITVGINTYYFPFKYKIRDASIPLKEYSMVFRLSEQYLIRSEARIKQDEISLGIEDLNKLRDRSRANATVEIPDPLPPLSPELSKSLALQAVENERRSELFTEWGHRWLDLKRTGRADEVLNHKKSMNWQATDQFYPIPQSEILRNPNLKQNR